jgi:small subunit ribosomal protein S1
VTAKVTAVTDGGLEVKFWSITRTCPFIRRSDLSRDRDEQRPERFSVGQTVDARVTSSTRRPPVGLSIKALEIAEEKQAVAQFGSSDSGASLGDILGAALKKQNSDD